MNLKILLLVGVPFVFGCATSPERSWTISKGNIINFDRPGYDVGATPKALAPSELNGVGTQAVWRVAEDATAPNGKQVITVDAKNPGPVHNIALYELLVAGDFEAEVSIKARTGELDQGGGLIFRAQDPRNFYLVRWNPLEENIRIYQIVDGFRRQFGDCDGPGTKGWHKLGVRVVGDRIDVYFDGERKMGFRHDVFPKPGKVGLYSKSDASSSFDDLRVRYIHE